MCSQIGISLPARITEYSPLMMDRLCFGGEFVWGRLTRQGTNGELSGNRAALSRTGPLTLALREDLPWLLDEPTGQQNGLSGAAKEVLEFLSQYGASFFSDIVAGTRRLPAELEGALWQLVAAGRVTADGFSALRGLITGSAKRAYRRSRIGLRPRRRFHTSRWSLLQSGAAPVDALGFRAAQLLRRYGIVFPELLAPRWRSLLQWYRRAEARGQIRGGRFVAGFVGEQFSLPEAIEMLCAVIKSEPTGELLRVSACDPLNVAGVLTPGPRVAAVLGKYVIFQDWVPVASLQSGEQQVRPDLDETTAQAVSQLLNPRRLAAAPPHPSSTPEIRTVAGAV